MLDGIINYDMACKRSKYFRLFYFDDLFDFFTNAKKKMFTPLYNNIS